MENYEFSVTQALKRGNARSLPLDLKASPQEMERLARVQDYMRRAAKEARGEPACDPNNALLRVLAAPSRFGIDTLR